MKDVKLTIFVLLVRMKLGLVQTLTVRDKLPTDGGSQPHFASICGSACKILKEIVVPKVDLFHRTHTEPTEGWQGRGC